MKITVCEKKISGIKMVYNAGSWEELANILQETDNFTYSIETSETLLACYGDREDIPGIFLEHVKKYGGKFFFANWADGDQTNTFVDYVGPDNLKESITACLSRDSETLEISVEDDCLSEEF